MGPIRELNPGHKYNIIRPKPEVTDSKVYFKIFWNQINGTKYV